MEYTDTISIEMGRQKRVALVAHDGRKQDMVNWARENKEKLAYHFLCGTGTTSRLIASELSLPVTPLNSGPLGGDMQIASRIVEGKIDMMIFFWDPLTAQPHDPDVKALLRIAALYNIPVATNRATADFLLSSPLMTDDYTREVIDYSTRLRKK